ncbi:MAG TPA: arsenite methyltransferase [Actinomycetota bacterium]|nr:arsenite methyltransferase [Actinomycetota bacterium]
MSDVREEVRERYAEAARAASANKTDAAAFESNEAPCCGPDCCGGSTAEAVDTPVFGSSLYKELEDGAVPDTALLASLGCGNPTAVAELREGETVLDLGSGGGIDVFLSATRVGPTGKAYGLDMTDEMLELARTNQKKAGVENVEFLKGYIEDIPLPDASIDVVISNCVINLSGDKQAVFNEMARVVKPGGRIGVSDVVASNDLSSEERAQRGSYVGCIAGALSFKEYEDGLTAAGFVDIEVTPTHSVADEMFSAIVKAERP